MRHDSYFFFFFFFNDTATTEIYTLSLHDALPILASVKDYAILLLDSGGRVATWNAGAKEMKGYSPDERSEEHTSELQSQSNLVCRLLLEKKKKKDMSDAMRYLLSDLSRTA